jgi:hypothetical protein
MRYRNLNLAFLIEIFIGLGTILTISLIGYKGLAGVALIALRPFVLEREEIVNNKDYLSFFYKVLSHSLTITALFIVVLLVIIFFFPTLSPNIPTSEKILIQLMPFFLLTHGVVGIIYSSNLDQKK